MEPIIEVKNLSHIYYDSQNREIRALDSVSMSIAQGEFVAVIGTNGSGKSTLARHFNALLRPTEGTCLINIWKKISGISDRPLAWFSRILITR